MMIAPISIAAILMHEAYLFIHLPVVAGILLVEAERANKASSQRSGRRVSREVETAIVVLGAIAAAFSAMVWGSAAPETHAHIKESMRAAGFDSTEASLSTTIWVYSLRDTMAQTFHRYTVLKGQVHTALFLAFGAVASWIYVRIVGALHVKDAFRKGAAAAHPPLGPAERYLLFSPFLVLGLLFIGFDAGRWCAWMAVNQAFISLYLIETSGDDGARAAALARMPRYTAAAALVGPVGVTNALPLLVWIVRSATQ